MDVVAQSALAFTQNLTGIISYSLTSNGRKGQKNCTVLFWGESHCCNTVVLTYGRNGFCDAHLALKTHIYLMV